MYPLLFISLTPSILFIQWHSKIVKGRYNITKTYPYIKNLNGFARFFNRNMFYGFVTITVRHRSKISLRTPSCVTNTFFARLVSWSHAIELSFFIIHYHFSVWCIVTLICSWYPTLLLERISYFKPQIVSFLHQIKKLSPKRMR